MGLPNTSAMVEGVIDTNAVLLLRCADLNLVTDSAETTDAATEESLLFFDIQPLQYPTETSCKLAGACN